MATLEARVEVVTPFQQNCAILRDRDTGRAAVIDPGGEVERLLKAIDDMEAEVEKIVLTHGHIDHAGGAMELKERLAARGSEAPIIGPDRRDQFLLEGLEQQARDFGVSGLEARDVAPDRWLEHGESLEIAGVAFDVRHCPGHSPGHVAFVAPDLHFAILGDVLFRGSIGRTDFPYGDHKALLEAIRVHLLTLDDATRFLCGHGPASTIGEERRRNPFLAQITR